MKVWLVIFGVGLTSLLLRSSSLVLLRGRTLPPWLVGALPLVPAAVLAALIVPALLVHQGHVEIVSPRLLAGLVAGVVAWRTKSTLWTLAVGLGLLVGAQALGWA